MNKILSDKIRVISFLCTVMVVFRHSLNLQAFGLSSYGNPHVAIIEHGISKITEVAVPYFFIISGYFFLRYSYYGNGEYMTMVRKKYEHYLFHSYFGTSWESSLSC